MVGHSNIAADVTERTVPYCIQGKIYSLSVE